ncbi:hypothetical protein EJB05_31196, partial [Eragrostis curvula]
MAGLHFVLVPLVAQGHIIPMVDLARLLAARGARATVVTTPVNAARNRASIDGARAAGLDVELAEIPFPGPEHGLPEGLENVDQMSEKEMFLPFFKALWRMDAALDAYVRSLLAQGRRPDCVVADSCNPWAASVCARHGVPRLVLHCPSAYYLLAEHNLSKHGVYARVADELEEFEVPDFPVRAVGNAATFRGFFQWPGAENERRDIIDAEASADGLIVNTFRDAEGVFVDGYAAALGKKTWAVGPTCASSIMDSATKAGRGNRADVDAGAVVSWLDARAPASVLYVSFGSIAQLPAKQLIELARGLEASNRPFIWAVKEAKHNADVQKWLADDGFEERVKDRGLLVRGWAPQVTILSHLATGGFLTHCGWNAALEAVSHGVPALTWPNFADQFSTERLLVDVLGVGVRSGVKLPVMNLPAEAEGVQVTSADVEKAVAELMDEGAEGTARRERAKDLADKARAAMEEGGSSYEYLSDMIRYVAELSRKKSQERDASASAAQLLPSAPELGGSNKSGKIQAEAARLSVQS